MNTGKKEKSSVKKEISKKSHVFKIIFFDHLGYIITRIFSTKKNQHR